MNNSKKDILIQFVEQQHINIDIHGISLYQWYLDKIMSEEHAAATTTTAHRLVAIIFYLIYNNKVLLSLSSFFI